MSADPKWIEREWRRLSTENRIIKQTVRAQAARIAELELEAALEKERDRTDIAWLQGKVVRQKRELQRLADAAEVKEIRKEDG